MSSESSMDHLRKSRQQYQRILGIIEHNTGGKQPATMPITAVKALASQRGISGRQTINRLKAGRQNGDIYEEGDRVTLRDAEHLRAIVAEENVSDDPDRDRIERVVAELEEVQG